MYRHAGFRGLTHNYSNIPALWAYTSEEDGLPEILSPHYFSNPLAGFREGDYIFVTSIDGSEVIKVGPNRELSINRQVEGLVIVDGVNKFPYTTDGVYTLKENTTYMLTAEIDLNGGRIVCSPSNAIIGTNQEAAVLKSTGLPQGTPLISSEYSISIRYCALEAATIFDLDASANPNQGLDLGWMNLVGSTDIGRISDYVTIVCNSCGFFGVSGLELDGVHGSSAFTDCLFLGTGTGTIIDVADTANITRRLRFNTCSFVSTGSSVSIDFSELATVPDEGYILYSCNFSGGGNYLEGVQYTDNKARFESNRGIGNSATVGGMAMTGNAVETIITASGTPVKVAGTTTVSPLTQRFTHTNNRLTYSGSLTRQFRVQATSTVISSNNNQIGIFIAKNGTVLPDSKIIVTANAGGRSENATNQVLVELETDDYIEMCVENENSTNNITMEEMNLIIEAFN